MKYLAIILLLFSSRSSFAEDYFKGMSEAVCRNHEIFESCFTWSQSDCRNHAERALRSCAGIMPPRPAQSESLDKFVANPIGAGQWSVDLGNCAELYLYHDNKVKTAEQCKAFFAKRSADWKSALFAADLEAFFRKKRDQTINFWVQFLITFALGSGFPLVATWIFIKRAETPKSSWLRRLIISICWVAGLATAMALLSVTKIFNEGVRLNGDNPSATAGYTVAFLVTSIIVPILLLILRRLMKLTATRPKGSTFGPQD